MEKQFLAYILYITLLEIRENALEEDNSRIYHLTDILHNVPTSLLEDEEAKEEYKRIVNAVKGLKIYDWWKNRRNEFEQRFPEFKNHLPTEDEIKKEE